MIPYKPPARYDPFPRGPFPVGVRTIEAPDTSRSRLFPCEIWYPADAKHRGQDLAPQTQDSFTVTPRGATRSQMAVRDAAAQTGQIGRASCRERVEERGIN